MKSGIFMMLIMMNIEGVIVLRNFFRMIHQNLKNNHLYWRVQYYENATSKILYVEITEMA